MKKKVLPLRRRTSLSQRMPKDFEDEITDFQGDGFLTFIGRMVQRLYQ
jgi:hypothetical protein